MLRHFVAESNRNQESLACHRLSARNVKLLIMLSTMLGVRLKAPLSSRASSSCAARSGAGAPRSQLRSMGLLVGPPGAGAACASGSRLCAAAGLLSGFSLGRRRGSTLRATETAESLECLNRRPATREASGCVVCFPYCVGVYIICQCMRADPLCRTQARQGIRSVLA